MRKIVYFLIGLLVVLVFIVCGGNNGQLIVECDIVSVFGEGIVKVCLDIFNLVVVVCVCGDDVVVMKDEVDWQVQVMLDLVE